jgi:hypothetical protein
VCVCNKAGPQVVVPTSTLLLLCFFCIAQLHAQPKRETGHATRQKQLVFFLLEFLVFILFLLLLVAVLNTVHVTAVCVG